jgi:outer membrane protein assembly factor BamB
MSSCEGVNGAGEPAGPDANLVTALAPLSARHCIGERTMTCCSFLAIPHRRVLLAERVRPRTASQRPGRQYARVTLAGWLLAVLTLAGIAPAQSASHPLVGTWIGDMTHDGQRQPMALRFALDDHHALVAWFSQPEMHFYDLGPGPVEQHGDTYSTPPMTFRLGPDQRTISGTMSFDGNELTFALVPGPAPIRPAPRPAEGRVARPLWTFKTGGPIWSPPAVDAGTVYFGSNDSAIYALRADRGTLVWRVKTGGWVIGRPTISGGALYVLSDDGLLYKLASGTGKTEWTFDTHGGRLKRELPNPPDHLDYDYATSAPTVVDGVVYVGSADKRLYAIDAASGRERWHFQTGDLVRSTPAVAGGHVYFGSRDHTVYAVDARTGTLTWKYDTQREVVSSPLVDHGVVYIGSRNSNLYAFDAATGAIRWKFFYWTSFVESSARIRDGVLYIGSSDGQQLFAIDAATGKQVWDFGTDGSSWSTPAVTDELVYIGAVGIPRLDYIDHHGALFAVGRATGKCVWRFPMSPNPSYRTYGVASSPATDDRLVYFGGLDGTFYAFQKDGGPS